MRIFKKLLPIFSILFLSSNSFSSGDPLVHFKDISLNDATLHGQKIFVSFYAEWCLPCKIMDESIFNDPEIANLLNNNFLSIKADIDSRSGSEWNELYNSNYLPTTLFAFEDGNEIERLNGVPTKKEFLIMINKILSKPQVNIEIPKAILVNSTEPMTISKTELSNYVLQMGAFSSMKNAEKMLTQLTDSNIYNSSIQEIIQASGKVLFRVLLNGYADKFEAQEDLKTIKQKGFDGFLKQL